MDVVGGSLLRQTIDEWRALHLRKPVKVMTQAHRRDEIGVTICIRKTGRRRFECDAEIDEASTLEPRHGIVDPGKRPGIAPVAEVFDEIGVSRQARRPGIQRLEILAAARLELRRLLGRSTR